MNVEMDHHIINLYDAVLLTYKRPKRQSSLLNTPEEDADDGASCDERERDIHLLKAL